jgi:hypothetical protein
MTDKPELLRLAKFLTGSSDIEELIAAAEKLDKYSNASEIANTYQHPLLMTVQADIIDFIGTLAIQHPTRGAVPFGLYDFQRDALRQLQFSDARRIAIASARQMGWTTMMAAHTLHYALNNDNTTQVVCGPRSNDGREFIQRVHFMTKCRPDVNIKNYVSDTIHFTNGAKIHARAAGAPAVRGTTLHKLIIMDAAYVSHKTLDDLMAAMHPALATGAKVIMQSTPKMADDAFHKFCKSADLYINQPWNLHPDRDSTWKGAQVAAMGVERFTQEFEAQFIIPA